MGINYEVIDTLEREGLIDYGYEAEEGYYDDDY